ncbi:MAG: septum formation protein Maf [Deltaproteobacteria bacterium]|nr:septum formation protein Maf [Deltaproteobacteria bacterium]
MKTVGWGVAGGAGSPMASGKARAESGPKLILASGSARRRMIFQALGLRFAAVTSGLEEPACAGQEPEAFVRSLAGAKARAVVEQMKLRTAPPWVVAADTVVVVDRAVFGQPADVHDARRMMRALAGRGHEVLTAVSIWSGPIEVVGFVETTVVRFRALEATELERYLLDGDWRGKAGAYAIQGAAGAFVLAVEGDAWNVVGFPVRSFLDRARAAGIPMPQERAVRPGLARLWPVADDELFADRRWGPRWG